MENEERTLNNNAGNSSSSAIESLGDLVSTGADKPLSVQSDTDPEKANNIGDSGGDKDKETADEGAKAKGEEAKGEGEDEKGKKGKEDDLTRFDQHPRFQQLIQERNELRDKITKLETKLEMLEDQATGTDEGEEGGPVDYKDLTGLSKEEILDWQAEDPLGFAANLARQIRDEVSKEIRNEILDELSKKDYESQIIETYNNFAKDHPDFDEMWNRGELQKFIENNPGHNAISAYYVLKAEKDKENIQKQIEEAVAKAVKQKEEEMIANFKAKRNLSVLGSGPSSGSLPNDDNELKNTKTSGGLIATLARRSRRRTESSTV